ncbi:Glycoside hydrolase family 61 [Macrophomina phaseolina MS6]|uniref:Glycoside hydrolase family 61 n=1 Tax=Macrophomina phaseolina (strain MS6) TaxID=1126212 RepID=K2QMX7_MACPH|nr:Glycoside hydrolase family 61 [Macrophomina phaseolina MS6]
MSAIFKNAGLLGALAATAAAHGTVSGIVIDGKYTQNYNPSMQYQSPAPVVIGWAIPEDQDNGFVAPSAYSDPDIICHKGASNAQTYATVAAGEKIDIEWTTWPDSHKGPVISYLAPCGGDCTTVDKETLKFVKIDQGGLNVDTQTWAATDLIANNNTWVTTIPSSVAPGKYVLRHEIIALHSAGSADGAQNYPQCMNLEITGSGSDDLTTGGTLGTALYKEDDPGILINIYQTLSTYEIPGPTLYSGASSGSATAVASSAAASTPAATSAVASSAAATSTAVAAADVSTTSAASTPTDLTAVVPSSVLSVQATAIPTASGVAVPETSVPDDFTVKDILQWFAYVMETYFTKDSSSSSAKVRRHARDVKLN